MVHDVPHREDYSMGGPWCAPIEKITLKMVRGVPNRKGNFVGSQCPASWSRCNTVGGPLCVS